MDFRLISECAALLILVLLCVGATRRASRLLRQRFYARKVTEKRRNGSRLLDLVMLPVTVTDRRGQIVAGLNAEDFLVFEDGKPQVISAFREPGCPMTLGLVIDSSESMRNKRIDVTAAALGFAEASNREDEIFVLNFNEQASLGLPPSVQFTNNLRQLEEAVRRGFPEGETALYDAILLALKQVQQGTRERKSLLIISDGDDNASRAHADELLAAAEAGPVLIYALAISDSAQPENNIVFLTQLAKVTGGKAHVLDSTSHLAEVTAQLARELRGQYTLFYHPSNRKQDGAFRTVRVVAQTPAQGKLFVHTRAGYRSSAHVAGARTTAVR
jgi:Ca-activated chloride channel homolog